MRVLQAGFVIFTLFSCILSQDITTTTYVTTETEPTTTPTTTMTPDTTTISTTPKTTTSTTPKTTTSTTPKTTTSTTPKTTTSTTTLAPITTAKPPVVEEGNWTVVDGNTTCIRANLKVLFTILVGETKEYIALSPQASSDGSSCNGPQNGTQELKLTDSEYELNLIFAKDKDGAFLQNVTFSYTLPSTRGLVSNDTKLFNVQEGNSYRCLSTETVELTGQGNVTMEIYEIQIEAFASAGNKDFGTVQECEVDNKVDDFVPIAVGCALLGLVVVVLIAYFVGRRRSRQKGYQSV